MKGFLKANCFLLNLTSEVFSLLVGKQNERLYIFCTIGDGAKLIDPTLFVSEFSFYFLRLFRVVPKIGIQAQRLERFDLLLTSIDVKDTSRARSRALTVRQCPSLILISGKMNPLFDFDDDRFLVHLCERGTNEARERTK